MSTKPSGQVKESTIVRNIQNFLKSRNIWVYKIYGTPFTRKGEPDLLMVMNGLSYFMEAKRPGERPTVIQQKRLMDIARKGEAVAVVVTSVADVESIVEGHAEAYREGRLLAHFHFRRRLGIETLAAYGTPNASNE